MRRTLFAPLMSAFLLLACQMTTPIGGGQGLQDDAIAVTTLDGPQALDAAAGSAHPKPRPAELTAVEPAPEPAAGAESAVPDAPEAPKSAEQVLCERSKGQWVAAGETGAFYCASTTRDGGKQCSKKTQCQGQCLARSGTCSPVTPLYGCNEIFEKDGRQVTLCLG